MKVYFKSRQKARQANKNNQVIDCKDQPSLNGWRWAVVLKKNKNIVL